MTPIKPCGDTKLRITSARIQSHSIRIPLGHMQLDCGATSLPGALPHARQQLPRHSASAEGRQHLNRPDVGRSRIIIAAQPHNSEANAHFIHNPQPDAAIGIVRESAHQPAAEAHRWLEARLLNRVERTQIGSLKQTRCHCIKWRHDCWIAPERFSSIFQ